MNKLNNIELLSPAGNFDCGIAAFSYGANAIYLGLSNFSARADAINFNQLELEKITTLAHGLNKLVYVAINTLIQNNEIDKIIETISIAHNANVDGIIVQDFGVANIIKKYFPSLSLHASTQMTVHNLEGAIALKKLGFKRVVLARELTLNEIETITKNCGIETEVFIHGALCYSYSGLCLYSSFQTGKSANRGKCTYPCRKIYNNTHPYSMKDLSIGEYVLKLQEIGVKSLKIEGRKKTALYVAATTDYYRRLLDNNDTKNCLENIKQIFARPYTTANLNGKNKDVIDRDFCGPRGLLIGKVEGIQNGTIKFKTSHRIEKYDGIAITISEIEKPFGFSLDQMFIHDKPTFIARKGDLVELKLPSNCPNININDNIYCTSSNNVKNLYPFKLSLLEEKVQKPKIDIIFEMNASEIKISSGSTTSTTLGTFEKSNNPNKMKDGVQTALSKLGESKYQLGEVTYKNNDYFAPISILNEIRREFVEKLNTPEKLQIPTIETPSKNNTQHQTKYIVKVDNETYLSKFTQSDFENISEFIIDLYCDFSTIQIPMDKIRISIPIINRPNEIKNLNDKISKIISLGFNKFSISNISGLELITKFKITDFICDFYMYNLNNFAADFLIENGATRITLSPEDNRQNLKNIIKDYAPYSDLIIYADIPLFISDFCMGDCNNCKSTHNTIIKNCRHYIFNEQAYCIADQQNFATPANYRIDFCFKKYDATTVYEIYQKLTNQTCPINTTAANFNRGFDNTKY